jgi:hypothetical protein
MNIKFLTVSCGWQETKHTAYKTIFFRINPYPADVENMVSSK